MRLVTREMPRKPTWLFLENVANIRKNGLAEVLRALADAGYAEKGDFFQRLVLQIYND